MARCLPISPSAWSAESTAMNRSLLTVLATLLAVLFLGLAAAAVVLGGGLYDIAASTQHIQPVYSLLETTMARAVRRRAAAIDDADVELDDIGGFTERRLLRRRVNVGETRDDGHEQNGTNYCHPSFQWRRGPTPAAQTLTALAARSRVRGVIVSQWSPTCCRGRWRRIVSRARSTDAAARRGRRPPTSLS